MFVKMKAIEPGGKVDERNVPFALAAALGQSGYYTYVLAIDEQFDSILGEWGLRP